MPRNVEVKVRLQNGALERVRARLEGIEAEDLGPLRQEDVFFRCAAGRLKLRREEGAGGLGAELIFYRRPDEEGPKLSEYLLAELGIRDARRLGGVYIDLTIGG